MPTTTAPKTRRAARPAVRSFLSRHSGVRLLLEELTRELNVLVSPSLSYIRISDRDGQVLGYAIPSLSRVRLDLPAAVDRAPAKLRARVERGGHDRRKLEVRSSEDIAQARALLLWISEQVKTEA